ncbi:hypothetical protein BT96DRAFT_950281 [Gymnopus androsaceus JB14]|uniref:Uncharacterized protein n=1 Tax=Gymnopus androsaceus JB14 TaxID=1447944 RepID=A0A6A4GGU6_9AGAR|nr:hypothetical protein BT96DRAFT_950281 [Gymnopus androsaceus JB14]
MDPACGEADAGTGKGESPGSQAVQETLHLLVNAYTHLQNVDKALFYAKRLKPVYKAFEAVDLPVIPSCIPVHLCEIKMNISDEAIEKMEQGKTYTTIPCL